MAGGLRATGTNVLGAMRRWVPRRSATLANRSDYKGTWEALSRTVHDAKLGVAASDQEADFERTGRHTMDLLERFVGIRPSDTILEIGCGVGRVGRFLAPRCAQWIGTDISGNMLRHAAARLADLPNVKLVELQEVGLREIGDASIDLVYCTVVFMHLFEWDRYRYVREAFRVLRPGGRCFFDNVDITSPHGWQVFMTGASLAPAARPAHLSMVSSGDELRTYAEKAGFSGIEVHRWDDAWVGVTGRKP